MEVCVHIVVVLLVSGGVPMTSISDKIERRKMIEITSANFDSEVKNSDVPVILDFWAPWCGPCRQIAPMIDELADENPSVKIGKVNIDDNPAVAQRFGINSIPTLLMFKGGEVCESFVGVRPKAALQEALDQA